MDNKHTEIPYKAIKAPPNDFSFQACNNFEAMREALNSVYETRNGLPLELAESIRAILVQIKE